MGCHGALSVSDVTVSGLRRPDWAQTLSGQGAVFAGNTGYGYGDDAVVGATEDLMRRFATALDGRLTIGQAMALAKQQYQAANEANITPFDEKVLAEVVVYGLPQLRVGSGTPTPPPPNPSPTVDPETGLAHVPVTLTGTPGQEFQLVTSDRGQYFAFRGDQQTTADQPVQPRHVVDLTQAGRRLQGVLLTDLESVDQSLPDPVYFTPAVDLGSTAPEVRTTTAIFPSALQSVSRFTSPTGPRDQAVLVPGQFIGVPDHPTGGGTQRLFTSTTARALYAPIAGPGVGDVQTPRIVRSEAVLDDLGRLTFRVRVDDAGTLVFVNALFTDAGHPGEWQALRLVRQADGTFAETTSIASTVVDVDFIVQAVDAGGNVATSTNKGALFRSVPLGPPSITVNGPLGPSGWYTGPATVTVSPHPTGGVVAVTVNGQTATAPITLTADGAYEIVATTTPGGPSTSATVRVDAGAPEDRVVEGSRDDPVAGTGHGQPARHRRRHRHRHHHLLGRGRPGATAGDGAGTDGGGDRRGARSHDHHRHRNGPTRPARRAHPGRRRRGGHVRRRPTGRPVRAAAHPVARRQRDDQLHGQRCRERSGQPASGEPLTVDVGGEWRRDRRGRNRVGQRVRRRRQLHQDRSVRPAEGRSSSADRPRRAAAAGRADPAP